MKLERDKRFSVWMLMDEDGYATEIVVTEGPRPEGKHVVGISHFINRPTKLDGPVHSYSTLGGIPVTVTGPSKAEILLQALRDIVQLAVEPDDNPMHALQTAQDIAETARAEVGDVSASQ